MNKVLGVCDFVAPELCVPVGVLAVGRCLRPRTIKTTSHTLPPHAFNMAAGSAAAPRRRRGPKLISSKVPGATLRARTAALGTGVRYVCSPQTAVPTSAAANRPLKAPFILIAPGYSAPEELHKVEQSAAARVHMVDSIRSQVLLIEISQVANEWVEQDEMSLFKYWFIKQAVSRHKGFISGVSTQRFILFVRRKKYCTSSWQSWTNVNGIVAGPCSATDVGGVLVAAARVCARRKTRRPPPLRLFGDSFAYLVVPETMIK
ncbi:hypothetical protein GEV33_011030 [Tenebrio molitor]|uniref:Uncharacterized protein n=1 Tax=Tenebrio molitor TaxID=7067 RepID=A0A8J6L8H1_TENMO|nr:hypothetical protein GEV33_011030 [Tenebrio molitor]